MHIAAIRTDEQSNELYVQEVRFSYALRDRIGWLAGVSYLNDVDQQARTVGAPNQPRDIIGVTNRTGGLAVAAGVGRVLDFRPDSIVVGEMGLRRQRSGATGLELSTAVSYARWLPPPRPAMCAVPLM